MNNKRHNTNTEPETWERVATLPRETKDIRNNLLGKRLNCPKGYLQTRDSLL